MSKRKVSSGMSRPALVLQTRLQGLRLVRAQAQGRQWVVLPPALLHLLGWRVGQRMKWQVINGGLRLSLLQKGHALARQRSGVERVQSQRRWQAVLRQLQRQRHHQGWAVVKTSGVSS